MNIIHIGDNLGHMLIPELISDGIIVDGGANVGRFIKRIRDLGINNKIIAIEPCIRNINILRDLKLDNVDLLTCALVGSDIFGNVSFFDIEGLKGEWGNITGINLKPALARGNKHTTYEVETVRLNDIAGKIDYLKLDVEGSESDIIKKLTSSDVSRIMQISIEIHNKDHDSLISHLNEIGYKTKWFEKYKELYAVNSGIFDDSLD